MLRCFQQDRSGATSVEYALIVTLVFLVALGGMTLLGKNINTMYNTVATTIVGSSS